LLSLLGGLEAVQRGSVMVGDVDLKGLASPALASFRQTTVGFVFQHYGLLETLTALENVELAGALKGIRKRARRERSRELLDAVGLSERADHRPLEMSGGERQRVAIARAMVNEPSLVLADEPTGNLDDESSATVVELLERMRRENGCTLVMVTHSGALAARAERRLDLTPPVSA
jgi:putative ABC transport system ATP-binding protein